MTTVRDLVFIVLWISVIVYVSRQTRRKEPSAARTGARGRRLRDRPGNGGMARRFTAPPRYHPEVDSSPEIPPDQLAVALAGLTPSTLCTSCVAELVQARATSQPDPEVLPGVVMGEVVINGRPSTGMLCLVRHPLPVRVSASPSLLAAPADALTDPTTLRTLGIAAP